MTLRVAGVPLYKAIGTGPVNVTQVGAVPDDAITAVFVPDTPTEVPDAPVIVPVTIHDDRIDNHCGGVDPLVACGGMASSLEQGLNSVRCNVEGVVPLLQKTPVAAAAPEFREVSVIAVALLSGFLKTATLTFAAVMIGGGVPAG